MELEKAICLPSGDQMGRLSLPSVDTIVHNVSDYKSRASLEQSTKRFGSQAGCANNHRHCVGIHRIVPRDCNDTGSVCHDNVLALTCHPEARSFQRPDRALMGHPRNSHGSAL